MFKKNQKIVCINNTGAPTIKLGEMYTIKRFTVDETSVGICLVEADPLPQYDSFRVDRFRPVDDRGVEDLLASILQRAISEDKTDYWDNKKDSDK